MRYDDRVKRGTEGDMVVELREGERAAFEGKATQYRQRSAIRGRLRITNQRVLFVPDALSLGGRPLEIPLSRIVTVRRRKGFGLFRTRVILDLEDGASVAFASRQRDRIAQALKGTRREAPAAHPRRQVAMP
jgi:hypothetical protein